MIKRAEGRLPIHWALWLESGSFTYIYPKASYGGHTLTHKSIYVADLSHHWAKGYPESWEDIVSGYVSEGVFKRDWHLNQ
jgi:hypothetical protein